jgi:hypothetical protein
MLDHILLLLVGVAITAVLIQQRKIIMTLQEALQVLSDENVKLDDIGAKLTEAFTEITNLIGQLQNTTLTPEQQAIVDALKSKVDGVQPQAQALADIVPGP